MYQITDIVKKLLIVNVAVFILIMGLQLINPYRLMLYFPSSDLFQPYQLVTHMFMHANISHLVMNMFGLFFFGPPLEKLWGGKRFFIFYFVSGFGALALHFLVKYFEIESGGLSPQYINTPMLGASGAVFGILAGFAAKFPNQRIMLLFPPIPMKAWVFVLGYAAIELFMGVGGFQQGVAHFAHLGGALFGFLLILYWDHFGRQYRA